MNSSYGLIEVSGVVAAIDSLDAMCKAATVQLVTWERKLGGRLVTIIVEGDVSDAKAAVEAAKETCARNGHIMASCGVIAAPCEETQKIVALSARRIQGNKAQPENRTESPESGMTGDSEECPAVVDKKEENHVTGSIGNGRNKRTDRRH